MKNFAFGPVERRAAERAPAPAGRPDRAPGAPSSEPLRPVDHALWPGADPRFARSVRRVIAVIDHRELSRACTRQWLAAHLAEFEVQPLASAEALERDPALAADADLVVLNLGTRRLTDPASLAELALVRRLLPGVPVTVLSDRDDAEHARDMHDCRIQGVIPTDLSPAIAAGALRLVAAGGIYVPPGAVAMRASETHAGEPADDFTPRQAQVLQCLRQGKTNKSIAYELGMAENTVKVHIRHIMKKLGATNRTQVALLTRHLFDHHADAAPLEAV